MEDRDVPGEVSEGDAAEQARPWIEEEEEEESPPKLEIPPDAPEADVLEQHRPADLDDEGRD